jgi:transposase
VSDQDGGGLLLSITEAASRLMVSYSTVVRLMDASEPALACVRQRSRRKANAAQVDYVVAAIRSGRTGSVEGFAAEWLAAQKQKAEVA